MSSMGTADLKSRDEPRRAPEGGSPIPARIRREQRTVRAMSAIYCRDHHGPGNDLCGDCRELLDYAFCRLSRCPYGAEKPTCAKCPIHCYRSDMKARVQEMMRYSGPRMMLRHPLLSILHSLDSFLRKVTLPRHRKEPPAAGA